MAQRVSQARRRRAATGGTVKPRVIGPFAILAEKAVILFGIAAGAAFLYLGYGLVSGHIPAFPHPPREEQKLLSSAAQVSLVQWVGIATKILSWSALLAVILALLRYYDSSSAIGIAGVVGGFLYLGLPALMSVMVEQQYRQPNQLTDTIVIGTQAAGKVLLIVAAARGAAQVFWSALRRSRRIVVKPASGQSHALATRPRSLLRQCWELTRCRSAGHICPSLRQRRSCWKRGSGCLCDLTLAETLAQGVEAWAHEEVLAVRTRASQVRRPCRSCPIYEEHQDFKYRLIQYLAYPITAALIFVARPVLHFGYDRGLQLMDRVVAALAFMPDRTEHVFGSGGVQSMVLGSNAEWVFFGCLGLLLLTYVLQGMERAVFRWGW